MINSVNALLIVSGFVLFGCSTNPTINDNVNPHSGLDTLGQPIINVQSSSYIFRQGDQLRITIRGYPEFDTTMVVNDVGTITMRLVGDLNVAGVSRAQLTEDIISKLSAYIKTEIYPSIVVLNALTQKVAVLGAVGRQENYTIQNDVTVLQILAMAGGSTAESDLQHIKIFRNGDSGNFEEIDITQYIANGNISEMPMVKPGDTVYVPREENIIRELSSFFRDTIFIFTLFTLSN